LTGGLAMVSTATPLRADSSRPTRTRLARCGSPPERAAIACGLRGSARTAATATLPRHGRRRCCRHRGGVIGLAVAREARPEWSARRSCSKPPRTPHRDQRPQQRGHPRRHLLPARISQGAAVRGRPRATVRVQPQARRPPTGALRQAHRGHRAAQLGALEAPRGDSRHERGGAGGAGGAYRARRLEPRAFCVAALHSPSAGS
jgi:hypothetical protein